MRNLCNYLKELQSYCFEMKHLKSLNYFKLDELQAIFCIQDQECQGENYRNYHHLSMVVVCDFIFENFIALKIDQGRH